MDLRRDHMGSITVEAYLYVPTNHKPVTAIHSQARLFSREIYRYKICTVDYHSGHSEDSHYLEGINSVSGLLCSEQG